MEIRRIADQIFYFPATEKPLSADVGVICCGEELWIFDVGASEEAAAAVNGLTGRKNVVLSHFHPDHTGNIASVKYDELYAGTYTCKKETRGKMSVRLWQAVMKKGIITFLPPWECIHRPIREMNVKRFDELTDAIEKIRQEKDLDSLRGLEGECASVYFGIFDELILNQKSDFFFKGRNKRPPLDNVNAPCFLSDIENEVADIYKIKL